MQIIDSKGKLFGKINLIDFMVIFAIIMIGILSVKLFLGKAKPAEETFIVKIESRIRGPWFFQAISVGDVEEDDDGNVMARIIDKDSENGVVIAEIAGEILEDNLVFKNSKIKVGSQIRIETENVILQGIISDILWIKKGETFEVKSWGIETKPVVVEVQLNNKDPWFLKAINIGDTEIKERDGEDVLLAKIIGKDSENGVVIAEIAGEVLEGDLVFKDNKMKVGSQIRIETGDVILQGIISDMRLKEEGETIEVKSWGVETKPVVVKVQLDNKDPWFLKAINIGDTEIKERDGKDVLLARIIGKDTESAVLIAEVKGEVLEEDLVFKGKKIKIGSQIIIETGNVIVEGAISDIQLRKKGEAIKAEDLGIETKSVVVKVQIPEQLPWFLKAINIGDTEVRERDGKSVIIAKILAKDSSPSKILIPQEGNLVVGEHPFKKDIILTVKLICEVLKGELIFKGNKIKIGGFINIETENSSIQGIISDVQTDSPSL